MQANEGRRDMKTHNEVLRSRIRDVKEIYESEEVSFLSGRIKKYYCKKHDDSEVVVHIFHDDFEDPRVFVNTDELITFVTLTREHKSSNKKSVPWDVLSGTNVVSAIIALGLLGTIMFLAIEDRTKEIPGILSNALTIILGFYFGTSATALAKRLSDGSDTGDD